MKHYKCMPREELAWHEFSIRAVQASDIERIRLWRNSQIEILRQSRPITRSEQETYFRKNVWPEKKVETPRNILLAFSADGLLIGYGGLVHIAWEHARAEISFLLDPKFELNGSVRARLFENFLVLLKQLAFEDLKLNRLYTETFEIRTQHVQTLVQSGFRFEGRLRRHVSINGEFVDSLLHGCLSNDEGEI